MLGLQVHWHVRCTPFPGCFVLCQLQAGLNLNPPEHLWALSGRTHHSLTGRSACQDQCARHEAVLAQSKQQAGAEAEQLGRQLQASRGQAGQLQQEISGLSRALSAAQTGLEQSLAQRSATEQAHAAQLGQATARIDR